MKSRTYSCWVDEVDGDTIYARTNSLFFELDRSAVSEEDRGLITEGAGFYVVITQESRVTIKFMKPYVITPNELMIAERKAKILHKILDEGINHEWQYPCPVR